MHVVNESWAVLIVQSWTSGCCVQSKREVRLDDSIVWWNSKLPRVTEVEVNRDSLLCLHTPHVGSQNFLPTLALTKQQTQQLFLLSRAQFITFHNLVDYLQNLAARFAMTSNNDFDILRDPRCMHRGEDVNMTDTPPADTIKSERPMSSSPVNQVLTALEMSQQERISQLLERIASLEADKVELQKATIAAKTSAKDTHSRYETAVAGLADCADAYAKRLEEKTKVMNENINLEKVQLALNEQVARHAHQLSDMARAGLEMVKRCQELEKMNCGLQQHNVQLEEEKAALQCRVDNLEALREERSAGQAVGQYTPQRYSGGRGSGGRGSGGRHNGRGRGRGRAYVNRFDPHRQPPTGPRSGRN
ncbi:hypothetical protein GMOD_00006616 [Pyrenophora seminiperda CCB06]|uniref:Uncharacterized protein n=1 Tax=Pyrenophora seminiperda CCB06 TaxID=1302712 RepID=A0A3M7MAF9_9PLEO|nr:hypothetical protein GMOD_00006616 [Pyrenophora seminiperda CCB06]